MGDDGWFVGGLDQNSVVFWFYNWGANNTVVLYLWIMGNSKRIVSIQVIWICRILFEHVRTDVKQQRTRLVNVVAHGTLGHNKCYSSLAQVGMMKYILPRICDKLYSWYRKLEFGRVWYSMVEHGLTWRTCHGRLVSMVHWYSIVR